MRAARAIVERCTERRHRDWAAVLIAFGEW
jgi:hypothetical protein